MVIDSNARKNALQTMYAAENKVGVANILVKPHKGATMIDVHNFYIVSMQALIEKPANNNTVGKIMSTRYTAYSQNELLYTGGGKSQGVCINTVGSIIVRDTSINTIEEFNKKIAEDWFACVLDKKI